jgi:hypothetical protein
MTDKADLIEINEEKYTTFKINKRWLDSTELEIEHKLAHLLLEDVLFCNDGWWYETEGKPWQKGYISHHVNCNDVFAWGCADAEDITYNEIHELYEFWKKDPIWGSSVWCIKKRKQRPQLPVENKLIALGYNIDLLIKGDTL